MEMLIFPCDGRCTMQNIANLPEPISAQSPPAVEPISARSPSPRDLHLCAHRKRHRTGPYARLPGRVAHETRCRSASATSVAHQQSMHASQTWQRGV